MLNTTPSHASTGRFHTHKERMVGLLSAVEQHKEDALVARFVSQPPLAKFIKTKCRKGTDVPLIPPN